MKKVVISVLGPDRPGIIATVTKMLFEKDGNIENVSQTILQSEVSGIFIVALPPELSVDDLESFLKEGLAPLNHHVFVKPIEHGGVPFTMENSEPFVITTRGPDRKGLVAGITEIIARYGVNVTNLQAIFKGGDDPNNNIMIYEVDVPADIDHLAFYNDLRNKAAELDLQISIQHRNIFEAIHRI